MVHVSICESYQQFFKYQEHLRPQGFGMAAEIGTKGKAQQMLHYMPSFTGEELEEVWEDTANTK